MTSKEELQSINEELQTVNSELKIKLEAISRAHCDLQNLMAATDIGTLFLDSSLRIKRFTERVTDLFSVTPSDEGRPITDFAHQLDYDDLIKDARGVLSELTPVRREIRSRGGQWYDIRIRPYRTLDDKIDGVVITFVDIGERKRREERQDMLLKELTHRAKNILAVVQAVAGQTAKETNAGKEFIDTFRGRVAALASAQDLLAQSEWHGADLEALVHAELKPYESKRAERVSVRGEAVTLPAGLATPLGLVVHELAVNAAKYGSLSVTEGNVAVSWSVKENDEKRLLTFIWREQKGPAVANGAPKGAGGILIDRALPGAKIKRDLDPEGVVCTIELPLPAGERG